MIAYSKQITMFALCLFSASLSFAQLPGGHVTISDGSIFNFGPVTPGSTADHTFTVTNISDMKVELEHIGPLSAPFSITGGTCAVGNDLVPSESCSVIVTFAPTAPGIYASDLSLDIRTRKYPRKGEAEHEIVSRFIFGSSGLLTTSCLETPPPSISVPQVTAPFFFPVGSPITPITPVISSNVTLVTLTPALPAGLSYDPATGVISGTPTAQSGVIVYTYNVYDSCGRSAAAAFVMGIQEGGLL